MAKTQEGFMLIADINGYTQYLSESELDHAQDILTALLELILKNTRPPLVISRLAGDAVISYGLRDHFIQGQTFVEMIETTYVAFRQAIERMVLNNNCSCRACTNINSLDLKFFVHYGTFGLQHISDHDELVGSDVNLIHRLLKNHVTEQTGIRAYTLYTAAALQALGIEDLAETMVPHVESYEHLGEVQVWLRDMQPIWAKKRAELTVNLPPEQVNIQVETILNMPAEIAWDYLIQPEYRKTLMGSDRQEVTNRANGMISNGSVYHCYHGDRVIHQTILEWKPFVRIVTQDQTPMPGTTILVEYRLEPTPGGMRLIQSFSKGKGPLWGRKMVDLVLPRMVRKGNLDIEIFKQRVEADLAQHGGAASSTLNIAPDQIKTAAAESFRAG